MLKKLIFSIALPLLFASASHAMPWCVPTAVDHVLASSKELAAASPTSSSDSTDLTLIHSSESEGVALRSCEYLHLVSLSKYYSGMAYQAINQPERAQASLIESGRLEAESQTCYRTPPVNHRAHQPNS